MIPLRASRPLRETCAVFLGAASPAPAVPLIDEDVLGPVPVVTPDEQARMIRRLEVDGLVFDDGEAPCAWGKRVRTWLRRLMEMFTNAGQPGPGLGGSPDR